jgi:hypothetical protein
VGRPADPEGYVAIEVGEWARRYGTVYVPWEMWAALRPSSREIVFYVEDAGRFSLEFDVPLGRLQP